MCKKLHPRRGQHPGERFLLGCENSVFVLGISYPTLSIGKSPNYSRIWLDPENVPKRRGRHKGITHCVSITTHIWNWKSNNFTIEIKFTIHLHTSILHSELATTFVEAAPAPEAWLEEEVVHLLTESYHWKHWAATCFATGMVASSSAFEGLSSVVQLVYQFLLWSVSRVPVIFEHARLVFVSFKRDSSARLCFGRFD